MHSANDVGLALIVLSVVFAAAAVIRRQTTFLRNMFMPTAVIGGFLALIIGPEGLGRFTDDNGLFHGGTYSVWAALPGLLVNVMCAGMLLGERLPPMKTVWRLSAPHVILAGLSSFGQFAIGAILVFLLLDPLFDMSPLGSSLIELSFSGGHGTVAGLSGVFVEEGAADLVDLGYGLATVGLVAAVVVGTLLVNFAVKSPSIEIARDTPTSGDEDHDIDFHAPGPNDPPMDENRGMTQVTAAGVFIGVSIGVGILMLELLRWVAQGLGSTLFDFFPLFPFTIIGGVLVQLAAERFEFEWAVNRRAVEGLAGIATDGVVICAIGTLSLSDLANNLGPLVILSIASVGWSVFIVFVLGRRMFRKNWFEHSITEFGEQQGNLATGYMMLDMVDPARKTDAVYGFSYRQLITRPIVGGGFISALSVPVLASWGLGTFTIITGAIAIVFAIWGIRRATATSH